MVPILFLAFIIFVFVAINNNNKQNTTEPSTTNIIDTNFLRQNVFFYQQLNASQKEQFEDEVVEFLNDVRITPINTSLNENDKLLVAASAVIPVFAFPQWKYGKLLNEVLLYEDAFNEHFKTTGTNRNTLGMVGTGYLEGKMLLSKHALQLGFSNKTDKNNTAIHEFVHLIDKADGEIDGVPKLLLDKQYVIPWIDMIYKEMEKRKTTTTDINTYGYTNQIEFFAVIAEYFFERPDLLKRKHPHLYEMLSRVFMQK
jgi:Mlc titration factor MtfA (ptsG expression regulator)